MAKQRPGKTLNPFAFPSETQVRFILLIWAILGLCWVVGFNYATVRASVIGWPAIGDLPQVERDIFHSDRAISLSEDDVRWLAEHMGSRYLELEKQPGGRARTQAALAEMIKAARLRLRGLLPYLVIPFIFLALTLACFLLHHCVARDYHLWLSRRATSWLARKPKFRDALQSLIREIQELQRQRGERPIPQPRVLIFRSARGDGYVVGSSWRPFLGLSSAMPTILREDTRRRGEPFP